MADAPYIGSSLPAQVVISDGTTNLFAIAARTMGDPFAFWEIMRLNGLSDYIVPAGTEISIPTLRPSNGGVPPN